MLLFRYPVAGYDSHKAPFGVMLLKEEQPGRYSLVRRSSKCSLTAQLPDTAMLDQVVETVVVLVKCVVMTFIASIKALLPMGVLPRKSVKGKLLLSARYTPSRFLLYG